MIYRQKPTSYIGRLTSVEKAMTQFDSKGAPLALLPDSIIDQVRLQYAWFGPQYHNRENAARALLDRLDDRRKAFKHLRALLGTTLDNFQRLVKLGWAAPKERRTYFNLNPKESDLGIPSKDEEVIIYAKMVLKQEAKRNQDGCRPVPSLWVNGLKQAIDDYEEVMNDVLVAHKEYYLIQIDLQMNLPEFDEILLTLWSQLDLALKKVTKSARREIAKAYGVRFVIRNNTDGTLIAPTTAELQGTETQPDGSDQLLVADVAPGLDPEDDLGVDEALREAGLPAIPDETASGGATNPPN